MSGDIAINPAGSVPTIPIVQPQPSAGAAAVDKSGDPGASKRPAVNPSFHVDLALNLVVLQFVDDKGDVTNSIPSAKQLKAYREQAAGAPNPGENAKIP